MVQETELWPIYLPRSDGTPTIPSPKNPRKEISNGPKESQLQNSATTKYSENYYREVSLNEPKSMEWRRKLATALVDALGGSKDNPGKRVSKLTRKYR
jgi:hypothetical protein